MGVGRYGMEADRSLVGRAVGAAIKALARAQLMGDVDAFVSCFSDSGKLITILDAQGQPAVGAARKAIVGCLGCSRDDRANY